MPEGLENFLRGIGIVSEAAWAHYCAFKKVGFNDAQAMRLTEKMLEIAGMMSQGGKNDND